MSQDQNQISVYIPTSLRSLTDGLARVVVAAATITEVVNALEAQFPGIRDRLYDGDEVRHYVNVYVNGEEIRGLDGQQTPLQAGDEVAFVPMLMGGSCAGGKGGGLGVSPKIPPYL